jgi:aspartyl/glutamyl-tRNA(Asn/Gln) amidotransferase C subunit
MEPHTTVVGQTYDVGDYETALDKVLVAGDYAGWRTRQAERRAAGGPVQIGIGVSVYVEITGGVGGGENARLEITEAQMPVYVDSLSRIIDFVEQLSTADTSGVEPMAHPLADQVQRLRADQVAATDQHEKYQQNAPAVAAGLYLVPQVIE